MTRKNPTTPSKADQLRTLRESQASRPKRITVDHLLVDHIPAAVSLVEVATRDELAALLVSKLGVTERLAKRAIERAFGEGRIEQGTDRIQIKLNDAERAALAAAEQEMKETAAMADKLAEKIRTAKQGPTAAARAKADPKPAPAPAAPAAPTFTVHLATMNAAGSPVVEVAPQSTYKTLATAIKRAEKIGADPDGPLAAVRQDGRTVYLADGSGVDIRERERESKRAASAAMAKVREADRAAGKAAAPAAREGRRPAVREARATVKYDPAARYPEWPAHLAAIEAAKKTGEREAMGKAAYEAHKAGMPITLIGDAFGVSAAAGRGRALAYATKHGLAFEPAKREARPAAERGPRAGGAMPIREPKQTVKYDPVAKFGKVAAKHHKAVDAARLSGRLDALREACFNAMTDGLPITLLGDWTGTSAAQARGYGLAWAKLHGLPEPDKAARAAARGGAAPAAPAPAPAKPAGKAPGKVQAGRRPAAKAKAPARSRKVA